MSEDITKSAMFMEAAAEARIASRKYWHGKPSYPLKKGWRIPLVDDPQRRLDASLSRHAGKGKDAT